VNRDRTDRGVTLIELMVVLALMATLMGIGISMYANLGKQGVFSATTSRVLASINRVRNSSMTHPAALQVNAGDPDKGQEVSVRGVEFVTMAASQCEPPAEKEGHLLGALDRDATIPPGAVFQDGVIGKAIFMAGGGSLDFGNHPAYDATEGVSIDLWVHPTGTGTGTLVRRGDGLGLYLVRGSDGTGIRFELAFISAPATAPGNPESATVETRKFEARSAVVPLNRWSRIVATYDRSAVTISLDTGRGPVEKFRERETAPLAPTRKANLYVGGGTGSSYKGGIDDLRIEGVLGEAYEPFPPQVLVGKPTRRIRFLGGRLDPAYHSRPEVLTLTYGQRTRDIVIGLEGAVESK
jgi:prepilin-type N-terminal cleavage/methylation domain-containing protein